MDIKRTLEKLKSFQPTKKFFIGIDSDGCAFDTMELKHKECFIPNIIKHWNLQAISKYARQAAEFVNLYSKNRGANRWPALLLVFDLLRERPEVISRGTDIPDPAPLREWINNETKLSNDNLAEYAQNNDDPALTRALEWSHAVNDSIAEMVHGVSPFPAVRLSLEKMTAEADIFVVSQTPTEALIREWAEHGIDGYPHLICGQELGTKTEHIRFAAGEKYPPQRMLMIGDAPGDLKAARANNCLFYPINPGLEEQSWQRLHDEALTEFFAEKYAGPYEEQLIAEFDALLPSDPPWKKI